MKLHYAELRDGCPDLREQASEVRAMPEIELQAHWFAGDFGTQFTTLDGRAVEIVQFGVWNHESGPDFAEAAVRLDDGVTVRGTLEVDPDARDWERHGHATNPAYDGVVLHLFTRRGPETFFSRTSSHRNVPQVLLDLTTLACDPPLWLPSAKPGRCSAPLRELSQQSCAALLESAARFRLDRKAAQLQRLAALHGTDEALYQALAVAFGYKENKLPFQLLAQRLGLRALRAEKENAAAILFGVAGFLREPNLTKLDPSARAHVRALWDSWWPRRPDLERLVIPSRHWKLGAMRPANHPQRRLAALAQVIGQWRKFRVATADCNPQKVTAFFAALEHPFWSHRYTLTSKSSPTPIALVGDSRVTEILINVLYPLCIAERPERWEEYLALPAGLANRRVETAALRLLADHPQRAALLRSAAHHQGLLQIYEDFCMHDASDCAQCLFPGRVNALK